MVKTVFSSAVDLGQETTAHSSSEHCHIKLELYCHYARCKLQQKDFSSKDKKYYTGTSKEIMSVFTAEILGRPLDRVPKDNDCWWLR